MCPINVSGQPPNYWICAPSVQVAGKRRPKEAITSSQFYIYYIL